MKTKIILCCLIGFGSLNMASAQDYCYFNPWGYYGSGYYYSSQAYQIPYFALYPPVYYSYPVARTYGYFPFPYMPVTVVSKYYSPSPQPQIVKNKYVEISLMPTEQTRLSQVPRRIQNPFVAQANADLSKGVIWESQEKAKPMIIHPASVITR